MNNDTINNDLTMSVATGTLLVGRYRVVGQLRSGGSGALARFGRGAAFVLVCEAVVVAVEWLLLVSVYGRNRWRFLGTVAIVMNAVSYGTGLLLKL